MDDFFATGSSSVPAPITDAKDELDPFQAAISRRFGGTDLLTAKLPLATPFPRTPGSAPPHRTNVSQVPASHTPSAPMSKLSLSSSRQSSSGMRLPSAIKDSEVQLFPCSPSELSMALNLALSSSTASSSLSLLIIDIRTHNTFTASRIRSAINLSAPSTLLRRPAFVLAKLAEMIPLDDDRATFLAWHRAQHIIVYDIDSTFLPQGNNITGLLRKFHAEGFQGKLSYVTGGFNAVEQQQPLLIDDGRTTPQSGSTAVPGTLQSSQLSSAAFQHSSTTYIGIPSSGAKQTSSPPAGSRPRLQPNSTKMSANPFYDNIRQNMELSSGITERIPLLMPEWLTTRQGELPFKWLREIVRKASTRSADGIVGGEALEDLAMQFYRIELGEQRRLNGVMEHHSNESSTKPQNPLMDPSDFPYSITAGVEKGSKNRYRNIWPFEHARVRLQKPVDVDRSDYINASYVQPKGTHLKYIATQGPLAATFNDFWTLCWEQNVRIIVMLTRQKEGNSIKCHCYWKAGEYGPLQLKLLSVEGPSELEEDLREGGPFTGFDFSAPTQNGSPIAEDDSESNQVIRRTFMLSHTGHPNVPARKIVQLQFLAWPDFNVPSSSKALLTLIDEIHILRKEMNSPGTEWRYPLAAGVEKPKKSKDAVAPGPVLVHCSAGVGRTGSFVVVDAVLDAIRREMTKKFSMSESSAASVSMLPSASEESLTSDVTLSQSDDVVVPSIASSGFVRLDAKGNEVRSPEIRSVKKRRSSSGAASSSEGLRLSDSHLNSGHPGVIPPVPTLNRTRFESELTTRTSLSYDSADLRRASQDLGTSPPHGFSGSTVDGSIFSDLSSSSPAQFVSSPEPLPEMESRELGKGPLSPFRLNGGKPQNKAISVSQLGSTPAIEPSATGAVYSGSDRPHFGGPISHKLGGLRASQLPAASSTSSLHVLPPPNDSPWASRSPSPATASFATLTKGGSHFASAAPSELQVRNIVPDKNRHPNSTHTSAYDYSAPRKIRLSKIMEKNLRSIDEHARDQIAKEAQLAALDTTAFPRKKSSGSSRYNSGSPSSSSDDLPASSPDALEGIDEPIRHLVEDMREQRMSLVQSLRQYVFVHLAILEGALHIVDQLKPDDEMLNPSPASASTEQDTSGEAMDGNSSESTRKGFDLSVDGLASLKPRLKRKSMKRKASNQPAGSLGGESPRDEKMIIDS